jgi:hypothetical protein
MRSLGGIDEDGEIDTQMTRHGGLLIPATVLKRHHSSIRTPDPSQRKIAPKTA